MSSESISPSSFYQERGFGNSVFYSKVASKNPNSIILSSFLPEYSIKSIETEHIPLVIQFEADFIKGQQVPIEEIVRDQFYRVTKTIYLNPLKCKLVFFSEQDKRYAFSLTEPFPETKYTLYEKLGSVVVAPLCERKKLCAEAINNIGDVETIDASVKDEVLVDRIKGFIVGYIIGAKNSIDDNSAEFKRTIQILLETIHSNWSNTRYSKTTLERIDQLIKKVEAYSKEILEKKIEQKLEEFDTRKVLCNSSYDEFINWLRRVNILEDFCRKHNIDNVLFDINSEVQKSINQDSEAFNRIVKYRDRIFRPIKRNKYFPSQVIKFNNLHNCDFIDEHSGEEQKAVTEIVNLFLQNTTIKLNTPRSKYDCLKLVAEALKKKELLSDATRDYFNSFVNYLQKGTGFSIQSNASTAFRSFLIFLCDPNRTLEEFSGTLEKNEFGDFRLPFAFWGLYNGYSRISGACFEDYFKGQDKSALKEYSKQIHEIFFGPLSLQSNNETVIRGSNKKGCSKKDLVCINNKVSLSSIQKSREPEILVTSNEDESNVARKSKKTGEKERKKKSTSLKNAVREEITGDLFSNAEVSSE